MPIRVNRDLRVVCVGPPWDHRGIMYYQVVDSSNDNENDELTYEAAKLTRSLNMLDIYMYIDLNKKFHIM